MQTSRSALRLEVIVMDVRRTSSLDEDGEDVFSDEV